MESKTINFTALQEPFPASDIEWRIQQSGKGPRGLWAKVIPYVKNRAIMSRLDSVCGPAAWKNEYVSGPQGGIMCGLSIKVDGEWVTKWDGAANTEVKEGGKLDDDTNIKGGYSASMKRAGVQWGIGRYLYLLEAGYAVIGKEGRYFAKIKDKDTGKDEPIYWDPPEFPVWALPAKKAASKPADAPNEKTPAASVPARPDPVPAPPAKDPPAPPPQGKPPVLIELENLLKSVFDGSTTDIFDEAYKAKLREEIGQNIQLASKTVAYDSALAKVKADLALRVQAHGFAPVDDIPQDLF